MRRRFFATALAASMTACGSSGGASDVGPIGDGAPVFGDAGLDDGAIVDVQAPLDVSKPERDGGFPLCDGGVIRADRFVTRVVSFTPGDCAGFGAAQMPSI